MTFTKYDTEQSIARKTFRYLSWDNQGNHCFYCGKTTLLENWTVDHKIPWCRGGRNGPNKVGCCKRCNNAKGSMTVDEFLATDYLPNARRNELGYPERPKIKYKDAVRLHEERINPPNWKTKVKL